MQIIKINDFVFEQETPAEKAKDIKVKSEVDQQMLDINKKISEIDLALANLENREKEGTLSKSESLTQQAMELQKKVAEIQKKANVQKKLEATKK